MSAQRTAGYMRNEKNNYVEPAPKKKKIKQDIKGEQINDKFSIINDIDTMIR